MNFENIFHSDQNWIFFMFCITAIGISLLMLSLSSILGGKSKARYKHTPFESGIDPVDNLYLNVCIKFYLVAIYFVLFDVESLYLYLWSINVIKLGWNGFIEVIFFVLFLLSGLIYLIRLNSLNWSSKEFCKKC